MTKRAVCLVMVALSASGCRGGDYDGLHLEDAWARPTPDVAATAAFFVTIDNSSDIDETLIGARSTACRVAEVHRTSMHDGVMRMEQITSGIEIPSFEIVVREPGGFHIMCIDRLAPFTEGARLALTLEFVDGSGNRQDESVTALVEDR